MPYISATAEIIYAPLDLRFAILFDYSTTAQIQSDICRPAGELPVESGHEAEAHHRCLDPGAGRLPVRLHRAGDPDAERGGEIPAGAGGARSPACGSGGPRRREHP